MKKLPLLCLLLLVTGLSFAQGNFRFEKNEAKKQVDLFYHNQLLTSYCYYDSVMKPILFPINTPDGIAITRGYPLAPRAGDRTDHPHHTGLWLNYESVNGLDFWNNSTAIAADKKQNYGIIKHVAILSTTTDKNTAKLVASAEWTRPDGHVLIKEITSFVFSVKGTQFFIDRNSELVANDLPVVFKDVKDGVLGIRLARELEMPSKEPGMFVDAQGNLTKVPVDNNGVTGMYLSSEGKKGDSVWGTKSPWALIEGKRAGKEITVAIIDHPANKGYPTYWHARGYGLFAANPFGRKIFSNGKEELNLSLQPGEKINLRYAVLVQSGTPPTMDEMNRIAKAFGERR
ncbi:MAG: PmoA family protein [Gemmatimonadaceae bacterium]|nr:PmoA family protein [Chitinophagaceae bacterium]